ncbi:kinase-like domain-containing protein [Suillus fuscotomentosus]|uniref:non-specific serine/threonine protein kinase n=1 Tax=Suillus fuscotomentosus TaxID=1912939 RepID=A0AAD4E4I0_9AGAM|nr:kinase-like domain-containing protein [Suillus fuscotomentosus]KAG1899560.1 kinase-like domain-containing protein [Suillus fuscotomentosus]
MKNVPIRVDGRFRLGDMLGSGSYGVVYHARNIINDDEFAVKLEPLINNSSSLEYKYNTLKQLQGGVGIPCALSSLEHIHSHNYVYGDIKPQNVLIGRGASKNSIFIVDFGVAKEYWSSTTQAHMPFRQVFASINNHLGVVPGHCDDLELLVYMLIYFICGSLPWLTSDHEKLSSSSILACKVDTTIEVLCLGIPSEITTMLIYSHNLAFSEDPDYTYLQSLLHDSHAHWTSASLMIPSYIPLHPCKVTWWPRRHLHVDRRQRLFAD